MSGVVVLNADYQHLHHVSVPHAIRMLVRQVAVVEDGDEGRPIGPYPWPRVLRLVRYVYARWHTNGRALRFSREGMLKRDKYTCRYCRGYGDTMDHVFPESRGGPTSWMNCVTSCVTCNNRKGNRTPDEARMPMLWEIYSPAR
jgi:5-methylcytosine-specific restriction endonuclease McrA